MDVRVVPQQQVLDGIDDGRGFCDVAALSR